MSGFHEVRFPADISYKATGGPEFRTDIAVLSSGHERRNITWQLARAKYELDYKDISKAQASAVLSFFMARKGRAYGFRFKDWNDFEAKDQALGVGDGERTVFQLTKNYGEGLYIYSRKITKPVTGSVLVYIDSAQRSEGVSFNYTDGTVTFAAPVENGKAVSASFEFDVPVRFSADTLGSRTDSYDSNSLRKIELSEIK